jgi:hypothetical protein
MQKRRVELRREEKRREEKRREGDTFSLPPRAEQAVLRHCALHECGICFREMWKPKWTWLTRAAPLKQHKEQKQSHGYWILAIRWYLNHLDFRSKKYTYSHVPVWSSHSGLPCEQYQ